MLLQLTKVKSLATAILNAGERLVVSDYWYTGKYIAGYTSGTYQYATRNTAQEACQARADCNGVTRESDSKYTLRTGLELIGSPGNVSSWLKTDLCSQLLQHFHRFDEELGLRGKWQGGDVTGVCRGWGTNKVRN